jgi:hypothetical protein
MKMRFLFLAPLLLGGCGIGEIASTGAGVAGLFLGGRPVTQVGNIDKRLLIGANSLYETTALAGKMAFQSGALSVSQDADTARENFCELVVAEPKSLAVVTDEGGRALALGCRIDHHLDRAQAAMESSNAVAYAEHLAQAGTHNAELTRLISSAVLKGGSR